MRDQLVYPRSARPCVIRAGVVAIALLGALVGCRNPSTVPDSGAAAPSRPAPPDSRPVSQSCTAQWRAHGHTTQAAAKAFAATCLRAQGAIERRLTAVEVQRIGEVVISSNHDLTQLMPRDIDVFCPSYASQDRAGRATFWQGLFTAVTRPESGYYTATAYWEGGKQQQYSIGLLQLSLADESSYRCGFKTEADITDPNLNLACGAKIMTNLVTRYGVIGGDTAHINIGGAAYWSTLRNTSAARAQIIAQTRRLSVCQIY